MTLTEAESNIRFLSGGGEMGALTRSKDWSKTPLGPLEGWPQSLRTMLGILLNSRFPMFLWWGPELTCFYNDAYRPSLGENGKHPDILGMPAEEAWTEIWDIIKPLIDQVLSGGGGTWSEDQLVPIFRNGKIEDVYWTFSYSPVHDETDAIAGVLVTCVETTEKVKTLKDLEDSNKRYFNDIMQAPVAMCIFRGQEHTVEIANDLMLELWGKEAKDILNKPIFEGLTEARGQGFEQILDEVYTTGKKYIAYEHATNLPRNDKIETIYIDFAYEALKNTDGEINGIVAIASDVTKQVIARKELEESEQRVRTLVENAPFPIGVYVGKEMRIQLANQSIIDVWGKGNDVIGKLYSEILPELNNQDIYEQLDNVYTTGVPYHAHNRYLELVVDGKRQPYYFNYSFTPLYDTSGKVYAVMNTAADVTDLNVAKQRIEESEKRFRNVADSAPVLIWMGGTDKQRNFFNIAWLNFTGRSMEAERGEGWMAGVHNDDLPRCLELYASAMEREEPYYIEFRLRRYDGEYRWISDRGVPRFTSDGIFEGYIGACMDIHERTIYEQKLKDDEERLSIVIQASELGTWEMNIKTSEVKYSRRYLEILGYQDEVNLSHAQMLQHIHPDDLPARDRAFSDAYTTGVLYFQVRILWNDKSVHWIEGKGKVFYDDDRQPELLIGTLRDITAEKQQQQKLEEREQKFRLLADSMPQFIWTGDAEGNLNYFNQSVYNYTGLSREEINEGGWLQIVHPEEQEKNIAGWTHSIQSGSDFNFEHRFRRKDGTYRWQLSRAIPQRDDTGNIRMWVGTSTDIQDQKMFTQELEKQVQERTSELEQKNRELEKMNSELQSFAYVSSHDLQEPLRKIQTFASRILEKEEHTLSETGKDYFGRMQNAAKRMQTLIDDLLTYSRTNITERNFEKTDLNTILDEVKAELKEELQQKHAVIDAGDLCEVNIIPFQFRQLLNNLISNSLKFSKPGVTPRITLADEFVKGDLVNIPGVAPKKTYCHIMISDNGIGFEPQYRHRIFEVFQRLHGKKEYKGTGIGLAIVKKIVENHNGFITATGELDKGARFDIYFPV